MTAGAIYNRLGTLDIESTILNRGELGPNILNEAARLPRMVTTSAATMAEAYLNGPGDQINTEPLLSPIARQRRPDIDARIITGQPGY